uniref:Uncharacterized protein n=1 Tax=Tanacetum cinerariifolium TaxID=118510 RepID=A0A699GK84_TANCI|nr:hypothetical protein [Tanacetum cinerariifolium]
MTSITAQQTKLDLELVPKENRLVIRKCNGRIPRGLQPKEETFQVVLDALALTPCYPAFVITADFPEVYMHQFWNSVYKHHDFYIFKIDKKKIFKGTLEVFRDILQICPRIEDQDFDVIPSEEDIISFLRELGHTGVINSLNDESKAYKTYLGYATGTVPPKVSRKFKKASPSNKDSVPVPADEAPVQKGKRVKRSAKKSSTTPTTEVALTEEAQMKKVRKKSLRDFHKSHPSGSGSGNDEDDSNNEEGSEQENDSEEHESDSEQDTDGRESDSESDQQDDDDDEVKDDDNNDDDEDDNKDDDNDDDKSEEITQEQVIEDAHVTITKKTKVHVTSSSRSSDLASKFLNFSDIPPADTEIISPLDVHVHLEVPRIHTSTLLIVTVSVISEASPVYTTIPQSSQPSLLHLYNDKDKDEGPFVGSNRGLKKRKTSKDAEPTTSLKIKDSSFRSSKGTKSQLKSIRKSVHAEELEFEFTQPSHPQEPTDPDWKEDNTPQKGPTQNWLMTLAASTFTGTTFRLLKDTRSNYVELEYDFEDFYKALLEKLDWENPEGDDYPFDLSKPLPLITTKAAQYDLPGIEDMTFYAYARGIQSRGDVYSTERILPVTHVSVMRKNGYGYLEEIVVRRDDNKLYKFKEGDFPRLWINDIEDMLLLGVQNRLTNLSGDDVADFAIVLRMFTKSLVIQKRVEDLQLGLESYQKQINNGRDLPMDIPLDSVVVLRYEKRSKSENKRKVPTEMELVLEQTQQDSSYEVLVSAEGVEE